MSDPKYAPYGVDDDPFLTHPAGVGRAPLRADNRYGQPNLSVPPDSGRAGPRDGPAAGINANPLYAPSAHGYHSYDGAQHGQYAHAAAPDPWAHHQSGHLSHGTPQPHYQQQPQYSAPQRPGNFHPREGYHAEYDTSDDAGYNVQQHSQAVDRFANSAPPRPYDAPVPHFEPRPDHRPDPRAQFRSEPRLSAPPHSAPTQPAPTQPAPPIGYDTALQYAALDQAVAHHGRPLHRLPQHSRPQHTGQHVDCATPISSTPVSVAPIYVASAFAAPPRSDFVRPSPPRNTPSYPAQPSYDLHDHGDTYRAAAYPPQTQQHSYPPLPQQPAYAGYDEHGFAAGLMPNSAKLMQWAGAACTVLALLGAVYWGYALAVRDAHGIPVVRAQVDPLRVAPETPGGEISTNQGLAVNNIPAAGMTPPLSDQITLAPQVVELAPEDTQIIEGGSFAQTTGAGSDAALAGASDKVLTAPETTNGLPTDLTALPDALPEDMPMTDAEAVERALEAALAEGGDPAFDATPQPTDAAVTIASLAPAEAASMAATDPVAPPTAELDPTTIAVGTPMAQLGAFDTAETARAEWANLQTRFTELMAGKALVVEPAKSGGRDFFRLRAYGFSSEDDTRRFCAAILAENGSCFPVDQR